MERILIVDDEVNILKSLARAWKKKYEVHVASSASYALELVEQKEFSVIISDFKMPNMTGVEFFECLNDRNHPAIRILVTGLYDLLVVSDAINKGFIFRFLNKPCKIDDLTKNVEDAIKQFHMVQDVKKSESKLRELNSAKDKFFSIIAHDLRSPLCYLQLSSELLSEQIDTVSKTQLKKQIDNFRKYTNNIQELLEELLSWSRLQLGNLKPKAENFFLNEVVDEILLLAKSRIDGKDITLHFYHNDIGHVFADKTMIKTAIRNVISNAIKFTFFGGNIFINIRNIKKSDGNYCVVYVEDDGVGFSEEDIEKISNIEEQFTTRGTGNEKGTGLGLILVKEFLRLNNGSFKIEPRDDKGCKVTITIPQIP